MSGEPGLVAARRRALALVIAVPIVLTGAYFAARETSTFAVRTIDIRGGTPALQNQVRAALALMAEARRRALAEFGAVLEHEVVLLGPLELPPAGERL